MCCISELILANKSIPVSVAPHQIDSLVNMLATAKQGKRRPRQRVSFQEETEVVPDIIPGAVLTAEERRKLWYHQGDLMDFKIEARDLSRRIRVHHHGRHECTRGLEHRVSVERQRNKILAIRAILKAQTRFPHPEHLAIVAARCTAWAKEVALRTGHLDFYHAYNPALAHLVPTTISQEFPLASRKRSNEVIVIDDEDVPHKRPRLSIPSTTSPNEAWVPAH